MNELESKLLRHSELPHDSASDGCVVFDNPGEGARRYGGGDMVAICAAVSEKVGLPLLKIPQFTRSEEVLESVRDQLLALGKLRRDDELLEELAAYSGRDAIITSGLLITRCMYRAGLKALIYIGPLELYSGKEFNIQDLLLHLLDHSQGVFFVLSVSEDHWKQLPLDLSTWQKVTDRMRFKALQASLNPIAEYGTFREYTQFLIDEGQLDPSVLNVTQELWKSADDKTYSGAKMLLGRS